MAIDSMRKSKLVDILKKETKTSDDFNFIDHYVMTYMPDLGKMLKSRFQKEACEKVEFSTRSRLTFSIRSTTTSNTQSTT